MRPFLFVSICRHIYSTFPIIYQLIIFSYCPLYYEEPPFRFSGRFTLLNVPKKTKKRRWWEKRATFKNLPAPKIKPDTGHFAASRFDLSPARSHKAIRIKLNRRLSPPPPPPPEKAKRTLCMWNGDAFGRATFFFFLFICRPFTSITPPAASIRPRPPPSLRLSDTFFTSFGGLFGCFRFFFGKEGGQPHLYTLKDCDREQAGSAEDEVLVKWSPDIGQSLEKASLTRSVLHHRTKLKLYSAVSRFASGFSVFHSVICQAAREDRLRWHWVGLILRLQTENGPARNQRPNYS